MRHRQSSFIDDLIAFEEWMETRESKSKEKKKKEEPKSRSLSFSEGMLVAFLLQWFVFPVAVVYLKAHGLM